MRIDHTKELNGGTICIAGHVDIKFLEIIQV